MVGHITISIWLFLFLIAFAVWAILDRVLIPSTRWFLRRRINRVIDEIGTRLDIKIKPFQITKRQVLIDRLVYDSEVVQAIQQKAVERNCPRDVVQAEVVSYAREIVPSFNAYLYFRLGYWLAKKIARLLYRVRIGLADNQEFAGIAPDSTVVFVMNHRSNMDYILVTFLAAEKTALSYAVGEWAKIWPLQTLIRAMGAYFVRRKSGNPLYRRVLERYIHMATKEGVCQAVFPEGGLSRDGRLGMPKLGVLDYMLRNFDPRSDRDIVFIPVGINYDRTLEDRSLLRALNPEAPKRSRLVCSQDYGGIYPAQPDIDGSEPLAAFRVCLGQFWFPDFHAGILPQSRYRFQPHGARRPLCWKSKNLAGRLMTGIRQIVPVLPISLVATVIIEDGRRGLSAFEVEARVNRLIEQLQAGGAPVYVTTKNRVETILNALEMLKIRRLVVESDGIYQAAPGEDDILTYYANSIAHWMPEKIA